MEASDRQLADWLKSNGVRIRSNRIGDCLAFKARVRKVFGFAPSKPGREVCLGQIGPDGTNGKPSTVWATWETKSTVRVWAHYSVN